MQMKSFSKVPLKSDVCFLVRFLLHNLFLKCQLCRSILQEGIKGGCASFKDHRSCQMRRMVLKGPYVWLWMPNILILMACVLQFILSTSASPSNILSGFANLHRFSRKLLNPATFVIHSLCVFYYRQCLHKAASTVCKIAQKCHWHCFLLWSRPGSGLKFTPWLITL